MKYIGLISIYTCFLFGSVQAQGAYETLNVFVNTPFFGEFLKIRVEVENSVRDVKQQQAGISEEEIKLIRDLYNTSAEYYNRVLYNIKDHLLDKHKRKYIVRFPNHYAKQVERELQQARTYYANTYQKEVSQLIPHTAANATFFSMLPDILRYGKAAIVVLKKIRSEIKKFNDRFLEEQFIQPYRFRKWEEIQ